MMLKKKKEFPSSLSSFFFFLFLSFFSFLLTEVHGRQAEVGADLRGHELVEDEPLEQRRVPREGRGVDGVLPVGVVREGRPQVHERRAPVQRLGPGEVALEQGAAEPLRDPVAHVCINESDGFNEARKEGERWLGGDEECMQKQAKRSSDVYAHAAGLTHPLTPRCGELVLVDAGRSVPTASASATPSR